MCSTNTLSVQKKSKKKKKAKRSKVPATVEQDFQVLTLHAYAQQSLDVRQYLLLLWICMI